MIKKILQAIGLFFIALVFMVLLTPSAVRSIQAQAVISTPTPGVDGRILYVVKENDTCISIALTMGITEQQLRENNNLEGDDCQFLFVGQELLIAVKEADTPTPTSEAPAAPTPTPFKGNGTICIYLFNDENGNALAEEAESALAGGAVSVTNRLGTVNQTGTTADTGESLCFAEIPEGDYNISVAIPEGYNPTTVMNYALTLGAGEVSTINFGAQPGSGLRQTFQEDRPSPLFLVLGLFFVAVGVGLWFYVRRMAA
jgi:LysM repeat protein